jgi:hypothetical protein
MFVQIQALIWMYFLIFYRQNLLTVEEHINLLDLPYK